MRTSQPLTRKCAYGFRASSVSHNCSMPPTICCSSVHLPSHSFGLGCWTVPSKLPREFSLKDTGVEGCIIWAEPAQPLPSRHFWVKKDEKLQQTFCLGSHLIWPKPSPRQLASIVPLIFFSRLLFNCPWTSISVSEFQVRQSFPCLLYSWRTCWSWTFSSWLPSILSD